MPTLTMTRSLSPANSQPRRISLAVLTFLLSIVLWGCASWAGHDVRLFLVYSSGVLSSIGVGLLLLEVWKSYQLQPQAESASDGVRDTLTGLANKAAFNQHMQHAISGARRQGRPLAVLCIDLDHFKHINDTLGHTVGDCLLQSVARRIEGCLRGADMVARWGGDEFLVGFSEIRDREDAAGIADKLAQALRPQHEIQGHLVVASAAIGVSIFPDDGQDVESLTANADRAMYSAKARGGNGFACYAEQFGEHARGRLELQQLLKSAVANNELVLFYQPQFDLKTKKVVGLEALLRWRHPQHGLLRPDRFLQLAEDSGLIQPIGAWTLEEACKAIRGFQEAECGKVRVAVNISSHQFRAHGFEDQVKQTVLSCGIEPGLLELELTEQLVMKDLDRSRRRIDRLRQFGVRVSIDNFGSGNASLSLVQRLTFDQLKIDRGFIQELGRNQMSRRLVESIIQLARDMGVSAVAEGVETIPQLRLLRRAGCGRAQGYLFGMPRPASETIRLIRGRPPLGPPSPRPVVPVAQDRPWRAATSAEPLSPNLNPVVRMLSRVLHVV